MPNILIYVHICDIIFRIIFYIMFKTLQGKTIELVDYIKTYITEHPDIQIIIGCDSQNYSSVTSYATVVVLYTPGHGGHVIAEKEKTPRERVRSIRLMNEVCRSLDVANKICEAGLPKPEYIDIDINPNPRYKSNDIFKSAVGMVEGSGYKCRYKTLNVAATCCADYVVRS